MCHVTRVVHVSCHTCCSALQCGNVSMLRGCKWCVVVRTLQCVLVCFSASQFVSVCEPSGGCGWRVVLHTLQRFTARCSAMQCGAVRCSVVWRSAVHWFRLPQGVGDASCHTLCSMLQCAAAHVQHALQHTRQCAASVCCSSCASACCSALQCVAVWHVMCRVSPMHRRAQADMSHIWISRVKRMYVCVVSYTTHVWRMKMTTGSKK